MVKNKFRLNWRFKELGSILFIIAIFLISYIINPEVFGMKRIGEVLQSILLWMPLIVIASMGMMTVILSKNIDLSIGSIVGLAGMAVGYMFRDYHIPIWLGFIIAPLVGALCGAFNGLLVAIMGIPAIIVTLGTLNVFRGLAFIIGNGKQVDGYEMPAKLISLVQDGPIKSIGVPWLVYIALAFAILVGFVLKKTHIGRELYAVGSNSTAARLRGINTKKVVFLAYLFIGACAGMAGIMYASRYGYLNPSNTGNGFEFIVISATIIGGVSIKGGSGSVFGVVLGSFLLGSIQTVLPMLGVSGFFYKASYGTIIIIALLLDRIVQNSQMKSIVKGGAKT